MRVLTPELESALDKLKAADDYFLERKAIEEIRRLWPSKNMPQVVTDHRVPPGVVYVVGHISHELAVRLGANWLQRPIPAGGIPQRNTRIALGRMLGFSPADLTLADPEE